MIKSIEKEVQRRGITRLCHFTSSRNLAYILTESIGIRSTEDLRNDEHSILNSTDLRRLDGHEGHICCSIQYPNAWYLSKAMADEKLFKDWVILLIDCKYLWQSGTLFAPGNAATDRGGRICDGLEGFLSLFADSVEGTRGRRYIRTPSHLLCCPTDNQAEVLIPERINISDISAVVVRTESQAWNEIVRLELNGFIEQKPYFVIAPKLFDKSALKEAISTGKLVKETVLSRIEK